MRSLSLLAVGCLAASASADVYTDATFDVFNGAPSNLDISSVSVSDDGVNLSISVTTRGFETWTKYMMFFDTRAGGTGTNAWSRPVSLAGAEIDYYIGSWVDSSSNNAQLVEWGGTQWEWGNVTMLTNSVSGTTVSWSFSLASMGLTAGQSFNFDVAVGGGFDNDSGVDHLSRSDLAMSGWGAPSTAGPFVTYTVTPTPGALALLGLGGFIAGRRRR